jgi:RHH-type rel operon transcriptional repressor/antitoxin RelB
MSVPTSIRLSEATDERLNRLAARTGRSKSYLIKEAIEAHIEDMEDAEDAIEAYMEHVRSGAPLLSMDEVFADLDD